MSRLARRSPSRPVIEFFASGLLHTELDFLGVTLAGAKPGLIAATKIKGRTTPKYEDKVPPWVENYLAAGGQLFCDSGAFTVADFTEADKGIVLDFNKVFRFYHQLLQMCKSPSQLILVMPDSVGEQARTIQLWQQYHEGIAWWLRRGCTCLFALQTFERSLKQPGRLSLQEMYAVACRLFGQKVAAALPMKKASTPPDQIAQLVRDVQPPHLHLLGLGRSEEAVQLATRIVRACRSTVVTADAVESTTAYGGRHHWVTPAARARVRRRQAEKLLKRGKKRGLEMWHRDRVPGLDDAEINWWLPTPAMGDGWQDRFEDVVQELVVDARARRKITDRQAEQALRSPAYARRLFRREFRTADAIIAMSHHIGYRMAQTPVPRVNEVLR